MSQGRLNPLALSFGQPPWCILPLWRLLNLSSQLSQRGDSGASVPGVNTAIPPLSLFSTPYTRTLG